jgi:hypothetical protein
MTNVQIATFGPALAVSDVTIMSVDCLREWLPTYITQLEKERSLAPNSLPRPGVVPASTLRELVDKVPAVVVMASGTEGDPLKMPDDTYDATIRLTCHAVIRGRTSAEAHTNAGLLELSVRRAILQQHPAGRKRTRLRGFDVAALPEESSEGRYLQDGTTTFDLFFDQVAQGGAAGPTVPDAPTYVENIEVTEVTETVNAVGPGGSIS